jgi:ATP-dependent Lon protease
VLDPAQNHSFRDHYLEFELDLSDVVFIATANRLDTIPGPLLDRVEVIEIDGYTADEKTIIAERHILPRLRAQMGLADDEVVIAEPVIEAVADGWTREAGVRGFERRLATLLRKAATRLATGTAAPVVIEIEELRELLGKPIPREELEDRTAVPGVATGLAVTGAGGDVLFVEATAMPGEPGLTLTGQLGDVMKESGEIARSFLRSNADALGVGELDRRFHVHFPAGAVPKDGPSAGITMTTALASLLTGRRVRHEVAMTGEVTLQGKVLPIGGVKQKLLAAHRAGITEVVLPARNGDDLDDVPATVLDDLTIHLVDDVRDVLDIALEPAA